MWKRGENLKVGDMVYHLLYGREWLGVVIEIDNEKKGLSKLRRKALVHMVPGSEYCCHFDKAYSKRVSSGRGWVTMTWLVKVNISKK